MIAECFRPQEPEQPPFGRSADGRYVYKSFCPSVAQLAALLTPFLDERATAADALPIPRGFHLAKSTAYGQLQLSLSEAYARRFRRVFGYIGEIKLGCSIIHFYFYSAVSPWY